MHTEWENSSSSPLTVEKELGVLVKRKLDMNQQWTLVTQKINHFLDCIRREMVSRKWVVIVPLCYAFVRPHMENGVLTPSNTRYIAVGVYPGNKKGLEGLSASPMNKG